MKLFPRSFLGRTILMVIVPMILLLILVGQAFFGNHWSRVQRDLSRGLAGEIAAIIKLAGTNPDLAGQMARDIGINVSANAKLNRPKKDDNDRKEVGHLSGELKKKLDAPVRIYIEKSKRLLFIDVPRENEIITFATTLRRVYSSSTELFVVWIILAILGVSILTSPFVIMHSRSIRRIASAANKFGRGMSMPDFAPSGSREIREAGTALITMKNRLDRYNRTRSDMLNAVSHDLKSPLARMRLAIETDTFDRRKLVADVDRMSEMINGYLSFARGEIPEIEQKISIAPILERVIRESPAAGKIKLNVPDEPTDFYARPNAISSAFQNIIDNAARYAKKKIEITETRSDENIEITVDDDGIGIPADRRADALRPFARLDESRGKDTGGSGLGLNIAQTAIENHGGRMLLEDSPLGGLRVRITLPI
jgi:two-component system osmolarity sensor histidine kinase EnvZ